MSEIIRVRFAPSPTGLLHIGGLRTALYNFLLARKSEGAFILRVEDTDMERYVAEAESDIRESLTWAGLSYDEGPGVGGPYAPYTQSKRTDLYRSAAEKLVSEGKAYYAFDTPEEITAMRQRMTEAGHQATRYDSTSRREMRNSLTLSADEVQELLAGGTAHVIRLNVPRDQQVKFTDLIRGTVSFNTNDLDDQVLLKSDGLPTYHLANVVDDRNMKVTHVIRGEEWLPSTPKHILLYGFLGWEPPQMAHLPLILSPTGGKLSKRNAEKMGIPVSVIQYREAGYEPEALLNFLAFLGWNPGTEQELFTLDELVEAFSLDRVGSAGVQFNMEKLNWYNQQHLRQLDVVELRKRAQPYLDAEGYHPDDKYFAQIIRLMKERITFASDLARSCRFFFDDPEIYEEKGVKKRWKPDSASLLLAFADRLEKESPWSAESVEVTLRALAEAEEVGAGRLIHPTRLAVSGISFGPSLFEMMEVLGREVCIRRLRKAASTLG